ncbi:MAG: helix-turn-helix domain-containing protein [Clostridia bacterium]|nr:helix-turn-helix domain-containing protein [Clostridia bacterium]
MDLKIAERLRKYRKERDMTQDALAQALGVSPQSISKWECGDGYPDITFLPTIANYFEITIDELMGNDEIGREQDIDAFYDFINSTNDSEACTKKAAEYMKKYPKRYGITGLFLNEASGLSAEKREEYLPLMRETAKRVMKECTMQWVREKAVQVMCSVCPDEEFDEWYSLCADEYDAYRGEVLEERLWKQGKQDESRVRFDVNNLLILLHFMNRKNRNWAAPERATEWFKNNIRLIEFFGENGEIPRAWWGKYANLHFRAACSSFGCGNNDAAWEYLEKAFELYPRWLEIPEGEELELGRFILFNDVKALKKRWRVLIPGVGEEYCSDYYLFCHGSDDMYRAMTAPHGWEWFNGVRDDERFKSAIERARILAETYPEPEETE